MSSSKYGLFCPHLNVLAQSEFCDLIGHYQLQLYLARINNGHKTNSALHYLGASHWVSELRWSICISLFYVSWPMYVMNCDNWVKSDNTDEEYWKTINFCHH